MFKPKFIALLGAVAQAGNQASGDDASLHCLDGTPFCERTREWKLDQSKTPDTDLFYKAESA